MIVHFPIKLNAVVEIKKERIIRHIYLTLVAATSTQLVDALRHRLSLERPSLEKNTRPKSTDIPDRKGISFCIIAGEHVYGTYLRIRVHPYQTSSRIPTR